ncbi:hypothetical protein HD554DRAFT_1088949 [Boletus coccyginus]|nr:hypothetical protein HD554DRAFT_1088949 [Boletus coccyginus]
MCFQCRRLVWVGGIANPVTGLCQWGFKGLGEPPPRLITSPAVMAMLEAKLLWVVFLIQNISNSFTVGVIVHYKARAKSWIRISWNPYLDRRPTLPSLGCCMYRIGGQAKCDSEVPRGYTLSIRLAERRNTDRQSARLHPKSRLL